MKNLVDQLARRIGIPFSDPDLALQSLTHTSFVNENREAGLEDNERLEFLGDAVIDLAISHRLMERFPEATEGQLTKIRATLVDRDGLAEVARALDLGSLLLLGKGEERMGGRQNASLLANTLEAVAAVVYLEGGLETVLAFVDQWFEEALDRIDISLPDRDYKTQLQILAQARFDVAPRYRVVEERGPAHAKTFVVEVQIGEEVLGKAEGRSKKEAEQLAAQGGLELLQAAADTEGGEP